MGVGSLLWYQQCGVITMTNNLEVLQKLGQSNMDTTAQAFGHWNKNVQAIAAEMGAYSKRTFDESAATYERLVGAKSVADALEIQAEFAVRSVEDYVDEMTKIGTLYVDIAKTAYEPFYPVMHGLDQPKR